MKARSTGETLRLEVRPFGPTATDLEAVARSVVRNQALRKFIGKGRSSLLSIAAIDPIDEDRKTDRPRAPKSFRALIYDYDGSRTVAAEGSIAHPAELS